MKSAITVLIISLSLLIVKSSFCQNSIIGSWNLSKINSKDSLLINVSEKTKLREFIIKQEKIDLNKIPASLLDTVNKQIDKEVGLITSSLIKLNMDSSFEISRNELLIPKAIPGIVTDGTIKGSWHFNKNLQILNFETNDNFRFQYKIIEIKPEKLSVGIIYAENQFPQFIITFIRS